MHCLELNRTACDRIIATHVQFLIRQSQQHKQLADGWILCPTHDHRRRVSVPLPQHAADSMARFSIPDRAREGTQKCCEEEES